MSIILQRQIAYGKIDFDLNQYSHKESLHSNPIGEHYVDGNHCEESTPFNQCQIEWRTTSKTI